MLHRYHIVIFLFFFLYSFSAVQATHNRAGEITYVQTDLLTIEATVTTYTKASSNGADRDTIMITWGDGSSEFIGRSNGDGELIPGEDIKVNYYTQTHTYPGKGRYILSFQDPNRVNNIQNVNYPNSVDVPFYVQTSLTLIESQFQGPNSSVILLQPPIDYACAGFRFVHNPNAYDPDGDSLSYELVVPFQAEGQPVPRYNRPDQLFPGPDNKLTIDEFTGDVVWDSPPGTGEFNIAIRINEYRDGVLLNSVIRDMQILVDNCIDTPPEIEAINELCVVAGERLVVPVTVTDVDSNQLVRLTATGGPFIQDFSPAIIDGDNSYQSSALTRNFIWETKCEHISDAYYTVIFRGQDNSRPDMTSGNAVLKNLRIKVVGPPPQDTEAEVSAQDAIELSWAKPYTCENALDDFFLGFKVYRREGTDPFEIDSCDNDLAAKGYDVVTFQTNVNTGSRYQFTDTDVQEATIYCYRVVGTFGNRTATGEVFKIVESLPSEEVCVQLRQDLPLMTKVSVVSTDNTAGVIKVNWTIPKLSDVDTVQFPGPYNYQLYRSINNNTFELIETITTDFFGLDRELSTENTGLNTEDDQYDYRVDFLTAAGFYSQSNIASSMRTSVRSSDKRQNINASFDVPWKNYLFELERQVGADFQTISKADKPEFELTMLENGTEYCYRIKAQGTYGLSHTPDTLINYSQLACGVPLDTVGPCAPRLAVDNPCDRVINGETVIDFYNKLQWDYNDLLCDQDDVESFNIYYTSDGITQPEIIAQVEGFSEGNFDHIQEEALGGCYAISAVDSLGNEGPRSAIICVDNCPLYSLPNTFTPNGDGSNDLFVPRENRFISLVEFVVYNRWGNVLFDTTDPRLNWEGVDQNGELLSPGTYYYTCKVFEKGLTEGDYLEVDFLKGYVQIFR